MEKKIDIEDIATDLFETFNLLNCFNEFCDESNVLTIKDKTERNIAVLAFLKRFETHRALLYVALKNLAKNIEELDEYICSHLGKGEAA